MFQISSSSYVFLKKINLLPRDIPHHNHYLVLFITTAFVALNRVYLHYFVEIIAAYWRWKIQRSYGLNNVYNLEKFWQIFDGIKSLKCFMEFQL